MPITRGRTQEHEVAVKAVRDYLVDLLRQEDWCRASSVGQALVILVREDQMPVSGMYVPSYREGQNAPLTATEAAMRGR